MSTVDLTEGKRPLSHVSINLEFPHKQEETKKAVAPMTTKTDIQGSLRSLLLHGILFISNDEILEEDRQTDRQAEAEKLDMVKVCIRAKDEFLKFLLREPWHCVFKSALEAHEDVQEP